MTEQPNTPSPDVQGSDVGSSEPTASTAQEGSSPGWWGRLFSRRSAQEAPADAQEPKEPDGASATLKLSQEELDRRVQSEADRREYARQAEQRKQERKRLRDEDPWAYAEQDRQAEKAVEQDTGLVQFFASVGSQHDRVAIDPLMEALPVPERERIMKIEGAGTGLQGRKVVVDEALKALEKHWKAEGEQQAEAKLRRNSAFRKQVLAESRGSTPEPELLPAYSSSPADRTVTNILRDFYAVGGAHHNTAG